MSDAVSSKIVSICSYPLCVTGVHTCTVVGQFLLLKGTAASAV